jgi:peptide/nickel transport system permease protein
MNRYIVRRFAEMIPVLVILSIVVFAILRILPGDPVAALIGEESGSLSPEQRAALERELGLDEPLPIQYLEWASDIVRGDWGRSLISRQPVADLIKQRLSVTLQLAAFAWVIGLALGLPIGVISALKRNSWADVGINVAALAGLATPNFLLGLLLIVVFAVYLGWLPSSGFVSFRENPSEAVRHLLLPTVALATGLMASIIRQTRSAMLEVMGEDYIRTARAKGLSNGRVIFRHALKNALLPVVTIAGLQVGNLASGTIIVETMFAIPGMGRLTIDAILISDFSTVQIIVLILAVFTMVANLIADLLYVQFDPRIRLA